MIESIISKLINIHHPKKSDEIKEYKGANTKQQQITLFAALIQPSHILVNCTSVHTLDSLLLACPSSLSYQNWLFLTVKNPDRFSSYFLLDHQQL